MKAHYGITADVAFFTTEYNVKAGPAVSQVLAAEQLLTAMWDAHGIVGNAGQPDLRELAN